MVFCRKRYYKLTYDVLRKSTGLEEEEEGRKKERKFIEDAGKRERSPETCKIFFQYFFLVLHLLFSVSILPTGCLDFSIYIVSTSRPLASKLYY